MHNRKGVILLLLIPVFFLCAGAPFFAKASDSIEVDYYYMEVCGSCNTEQELLEQFGELAKEAAPGVSFTIRMHNTMTNAMLDAFAERCREIGFAEPYDEGIFGGDRFLPGRPDAEKLRAFIVEIANGAKPSQAPAPTAEAHPSPMPDGLVRGAAGEPVFVYFYVTGCADCARVDEALETLPKGVTVHRMNVNKDGNLARIREYFSVYDVPDASQTTPILFFGESYLGADGVSPESLRDILSAGSAAGTLLPADGETAEDGTNLLIENLKWSGVFLTGLLNGLNPCGLSMLLFLLTLMGTKGFLRNGALFVLGKFFAYFAIGTLGYHLFASVGDLVMPGLQRTVQLIMAAVALVVAALHIGDYFQAKKENYGKIRMQIPGGLRRTFHGMIKKLIAHPAYLGVGCLLLGAVISAGEFLCTGQIYIASILYAVQNVGGMRVYLFFAVYVLAAVLPAAVVLLVLWRGKAAFEVSETIRRNMPRIRLVAGLFFLAFAAYFVVTAF